MNLKILTLNTQKAYQSSFDDFFARILRESKYDFILLQEATAPIVSMVSEISTEYKVLNLFDPEFGENTHECVIYKNNFELVETIFISFAKFGKQNLLRGWGFLAGVFQKDGKTTLVGTAHLHPGINRKKRLEQVKIIKSEILKHKFDSAIFGGDFNTGLPLEIRGHEKMLSPEFVRVTKTLGATLDSCYTEKVPFGVARVANFLASLGISIKLKADHVYVNKKTAEKSMIQARLLPDRVSDHLAVEINIAEPINIRSLRSADSEIIKFIKDRLAPLWKVPIEEIENDFILPSFKGGFPYIFVALTEDNKFAGKIILSIEKNWFLGIDGEPWISAVFVPEEYRGQGIAQKLITVTEETARKNGFKNLYLDTVEAVGYYEKLGGWHEIGKDKWKDEDVVVMVKKL